MDALPSDFEDHLDHLLGLAGKQALANPTAEGFVQWFSEAVPLVLPALVAAIAQDAASVSQFLRVAGLSLYGALPLPANGWQATGQRKQERNAPCDCGSGRKYKQCCARVPLPPLFGNMNLLRYVLDACPKRRLAEICDSKAGMDAVADAAWQWMEEGDTERAVALIEPYFKRPGPLDGRLAPLFNLLMDAWLETGRGIKRERLLADVLQRGDKLLRADALQRQTSLLADRGEHAAAWQSFREASALNPTDPALGFLEVTTLVSEGRLQEAQGRAQWWAASLARLRDPDLNDIIERLRAMAKDPSQGMFETALDSNLDWRRLQELLLSAPAPTVRHQFEVLSEPDAQGVVHLAASALVPDHALQLLETRWRRVFAQAKPSMTRVQNHAAAVWENADQWLALLQEEPSLWFSFDVLDDLAMAVDTIEVSGVPQHLLIPLLERAAQQLRLTLESAGRGAVECPWGVWPHRIALRPVAHLAFVLQAEGLWDRYMALARWMVFELNPDDNHGLRAELSCAFARVGQWDDVLALDRRYPDDMHLAMQLNAVLALWMAGDEPAAAVRLKQARKDFPLVVKMLLSDAPKPVAPDTDLGITAGSKYEAWLYVAAMRPVWQQHHALAWARQQAGARRPSGPAADPTGQQGPF